MKKKRAKAKTAGKLAVKRKGSAQKAKRRGPLVRAKRSLGPSKPAPKRSIRGLPKIKARSRRLRGELVTCGRVRAFSALGVDELHLSPNAKSAAGSLVQQFGAKMVFTSGRRDIAQQAAAMAPHVLKDRRWIIKTYRDVVNATEMQQWVDGNPQAKTTATIAAGLLSVMSGWAADRLRRLSWHLSGDAFDIMPLQEPDDKAVTKAIRALPHFEKLLTKEGNDVVWHVQIA
jgi:hypothetical protein